MVMPGVGHMSLADLSQFHLTLFIVGVLVHITMSAALGLLYGVLMPTLPEIRKAGLLGAES